MFSFVMEDSFIATHTHTHTHSHTLRFSGPFPSSFFSSLYFAMMSILDAQGRHQHGEGGNTKKRAPSSPASPPKNTKKHPKWSRNPIDSPFFFSIA